MFLVGEPNYYYYYISSTGHIQQAPEVNNLVTMAAKNTGAFENLANQFDYIAKQFEYSVDLSGKQIFPNDTLKKDIVMYYKSSTFNINILKYRLLGFDITASDIQIKVKPSRIDITRTKVDLPLVVARDVSVTNGLLNLKYNQINLSPIYGIYDKSSDKMTLYIPLNIALRYLPSNLA
jgi:hypothetical protein